jgi:xanthine dehydrogenase accessory factor
MERLVQEDAVLVSVQSSKGSTPRDKGAWMVVFSGTEVGTVGGGNLEYQAISHARMLLAEGSGALQRRFALGPSLGQCCGGQVVLQFERITRPDGVSLFERLQPCHTPVAIFGGGHVGRALVHVLDALPFDVQWFDSRDEIFPNDVSAQVQCVHSDPIDAAVADAPSGCSIVIMNFDHGQDLDVVAASLHRQRSRGDLPYVGLIGSRTKWASFRQRLVARGFSQAELAHITCPIGVAGIADKRPEVIAVAVAAQLLQVVGTAGSAQQTGHYTASKENVTHGKLSAGLG